jgi:regulation of enolase protein 1 (concanavalin A-like superfamily)
MSPVTLSTLPGELRWQHAPVSWQVSEAEVLTITAGPDTDRFIDPAGRSAKDNSPGLLFTSPDDSFLQSARVSVDFASTFDAGVLLVYGDAAHWAKLCFEQSPQGQPLVVSVVTRDTSDDCNSAAISDAALYLRVYRHGQTLAFHYALDGRYWQLVRYFRLGGPTPLQVGFSSQSPTGQGCTAVFSEIRYTAGVLADLRSGM